MKIATFNINNIKRRLPNLLDWLNASKPDVVFRFDLNGDAREELSFTGESRRAIFLRRSQGIVGSATTTISGNVVRAAKFSPTLASC